MGLLIHPELTLDCGLSLGTWVPRSIGEFLGEVAAIDSVSAKILKLEDYVNRLQEEMKKIDVFKRELPLSVLLINDAITAVTEELQRCKKLKMEPILEEFIPTKKISKEEEKPDQIGEKGINNTSSRDKMNWMSSVQLWNSDNQHLTNTDKFISSNLSTQTLETKIKKSKEDDATPMDDLFLNGKNRASGRAFTPSKGCSNFAVVMFGKEVREEDPGSGSRLPLPALPLSLSPPEIKNDATNPPFTSKSTSIRSLSSSPPTNGQSNSNQQTARKQRRCWSPELHRRFVSALQQLGGAQAATPKQIRELMQVDGLTNDEVKSHLQKYRLHIRKVPRAATSTPTTDPIFMGGLWVCGESSGSPQDHLPARGGGSSSDSIMEDEDEDDGKSRAP